MPSWLGCAMPGPRWRPAPTGFAALLRPNGCGPLNNDSDRIDFSTRIAKAAETYRRPDWAFMVSHGKTGEKPSGCPSRFFPWCGQLVSRSGWDEDAHWSFFDAGPWGIAHQHTDKLHLSLTLGPDDVLVDSGRFAYRGELARFRREYGVESFAHNTIVIDHRPQAPGPDEVESPADNAIDCLITPEFDYLCAVCDHFRDVPAGQFKHQRTLFYLRGEYWLILDRVTAPHPVDIQILWHWHPECQVQHRTGHIYTANTGRHNLSIASWHQHKLELHTQLVRGVDEGGRLQGWYSPCYNQISAAPVTISQTSAGPDTFILHLLQPSEPGSIVSAPPALSWEMDSEAHMLHIDIVFPESQVRHRVTLPLAAGASSRPSFQPLSG
ncbi:MAG: hypothetical protein D6820_08695 [Lentisphaerae bacterium]|nr:MAG: hypothetical protein D6820_08695 [Lentisphaerota bacterium]